MVKIKLSEIRELIKQIIREELDAYQPSSQDKKDTEEEKPMNPQLVEFQASKEAKKNKNDSGKDKVL